MVVRSVTRKYGGGTFEAVVGKRFEGGIEAVFLAGR